ncbi:hypothetical protein GCM10023238_38540 [Streptomyces heliomycini]
MWCTAAARAGASRSTTANWAAVLCAATDPAAPDPQPVPPEADRFATALRGLAELARDEGGLVAALRSETAVRALERACRAPGALRTAREARVPDLLAVAAHLERALRPLSLDWYEEDGLGAVDLCHAAAGGVTALPGLLAHHFFDIPLLVTEYGVRLRTHYLTRPDALTRGPLPARRLPRQARRRDLPPGGVHHTGNTHARRWQERCGADRAKIRTVYPGMDAAPFAEAGESPERADPYTLVWVGRVGPPRTWSRCCTPSRRSARRNRGPAADHRRSVGPGGRRLPRPLRGTGRAPLPGRGRGPALRGRRPVSFEEIGARARPPRRRVRLGRRGRALQRRRGLPGRPRRGDALRARATVSTDVGAVVEAIGGTGLVVPPRNPRAFAEACVSLLRDPERRVRLGAAARARALELFTVDQNISAFHGIYLEIVAHTPVRRLLLDDTGDPLPFAAPAESHVPGHWTDPASRAAPTWAMDTPVPATETTR